MYAELSERFGARHEKTYSEMGSNARHASLVTASEKTLHARSRDSNSTIHPFSLKAMVELCFAFCIYLIWHSYEYILVI